MVLSDLLPVRTSYLNFFLCVCYFLHTAFFFVLFCFFECRCRLPIVYSLERRYCSPSVSLSVSYLFDSGLSLLLFSLCFFSVWYIVCVFMLIQIVQSTFFSLLQSFFRLFFYRKKDDQIEYLVKWVGFSYWHTSWISDAVLNERFHSARHKLKSLYRREEKGVSPRIK